ncbi:hypothetical protein BV20DRAFT_1116767 [Pilatotrama ljubarskyi]|nr:hypothetical protein BV20DRAFT_1116767 [Pilatotrama ljubarskyi]
MSCQSRLSPYPDRIRSLANIVKGLQTDFHTIRLQLVREFRNSEDLVQRWVELTNSYRYIVADTRKAANTLSVVINLYTTLQSDVTSEHAADFVREIETMKETLQGPSFEYGPRLDGLKSAIETFLLDPRLSRRTMWPHPAVFQPQSSSSWLWSTVSYMGSMLNTVHSSLFDSSANGGSIANVDFQASPKAAGNSQGAVVSIRNILSAVDAQKQQLQVFREILEQLTAEFTRYSAALEKVADHSTPESLESLKCVQRDVASTRGNWQIIAKALANQYARALC